MFARSMLALLLLAAAERPAAAYYIDPGTGTWIWQMLIGLLLGVRFYFGKWIPFPGPKKHKKGEGDESPR